MKTAETVKYHDRIDKRIYTGVSIKYDAITPTMFSLDLSQETELAKNPKYSCVVCYSQLPAEICRYGLRLACGYMNGKVIFRFFFSLMCSKCAPSLRTKRTISIDRDFVELLERRIISTLKLLLRKKDDDAFLIDELIITFWELFDKMYQYLMEDLKLHYKACMTCERRAAVKVCKKCLTAWYCSNACQEIDQENHIQDCHIFETRHLWLIHLTKLLIRSE